MSDLEQDEKPTAWKSAATALAETEPGQVILGRLRMAGGGLQYRIVHRRFLETKIFPEPWLIDGLLRDDLAKHIDEFMDIPA